MIERHHQDGRVRSSALYSECGAYRYALTREWGQGKKLLFVMLNPSTADERRNDPTVERCERRARALGFDAFRVVNIFAYRATRPQDLKRAPDPIGTENDRILIDSAAWAGRVLCAWGAHGCHMNRGPAVEHMLRASGCVLWHLGQTKHGAPRHPLYISYAMQPVLW
ncbi:DUF1643 domain-containing protein [Paracoccus saliphilus]|uniref:DUF1643 domain-containing protein n=1 Tax=Paracoccus saliphilus TaxID=405559 RepID=A0AA45W6P2_9RHOB|nr:DUF1643 domain-containing protein [Paracoccus saliphilus]WCR02881.1 DUF1643 domain-containing protein [Paracoccus saliphilus]SIT03402.1 hypothetical protein SAMN05421772_11354 [Paracoccus saliphilus]